MSPGPLVPERAAWVNSGVLNPSSSSPPSMDKTSSSFASSVQVQALNAQLLSAALNSPIVPPRVFPGRTIKENQGAVDWGIQNLVAFGSQSYVVVTEVNSLRILQTLDEHRSPVTAVRWSNEPLHLEFTGPYHLQLASGDIGGSVFIWNVLPGSIATSLTETGTKSVVDMRWHPAYKGHLLVLYTSTLILWDVTQGQKRWRKEFPQDQFSSFAINPFDSSQLCLSSVNGNIYFVRDLNRDAAPVQFELKYRVAVIKPPQSTSPSKTPTKPAKPDFKQMIFSPSFRNIIFFVLVREILIYDLTINQVVNTITLERGRSPFALILLCKLKPRTLFALHENNSLSGWKKDKSAFIYELCCFSELSRFNKQSRKPAPSITAIVSNPANETNFAIVGNDGALWLWKYLGSGKRSKFAITGLIEGVSSVVSCISVSPFLADNGKPSTIIAIGTLYGTIQLVDTATTTVKSEYVVSQHMIRSVRWLSPTSLLSYSVEEAEKNVSFKNMLSVIDLKCGRLKEIRKTNTNETTCIRGVYVSPLFQYFVVLLKERPFELWDVKTLSLLRTIKVGVKLTALAWAPASNAEMQTVTSGTASATTNAKPIKEQFILTTVDSEFYQLIIEGGVVTSNQIQLDLGMGMIVSLAWKGSLIVGGDINGGLYCWNFDQKKTKVFPTNKGIARRIKFAPTERSHNILVLDAEGEFCLWDLDQNIKISNSNILKERDIRGVDIDWLDASPIVATNDGAVRVLDRSLSISSSSFVLEEWNEPIYTPFLLQPKRAMAFKAAIEHAMEDVANIPDIKLPEEFISEYEQKKGNTAERCLLVANFFGNETEKRFWMLVIDAFDRVKRDPGLTVSPSSSTPMDSHSEEQQAHQDVASSTSLTSSSPTPLNENNVSLEESTVATSSTAGVQSKLPLHFDLLLDSECIKTIERNRAMTHAQKNKQNYDLMQKSIELNVFLGEKSTAIEGLLQTPTDNPHFYRDALKACVIAAASSQESFHATMQHVASTLIANGKLEDGIQLLVMIGKASDACRYLQSANRWLEAAWLAKISLGDSLECREVMTRWADLLVQTDQKPKAVELLLTLGEFHRVMQLLHETQRFDLGALFLCACKENDFVTMTEDGKESGFIELANVSTHNLIPMEQLLQSIHLDYGFYLHRIGADAIAGLYWKKSGQAGQAMIETLANVTTVPKRTRNASQTAGSQASSPSAIKREV